MPSRQRKLLGDLALTVPFLLLFFVQLWQHQFWRDEMNAFALARACPDLRTLFHDLHYEGHPWLWYVLLWLLTRVTRSLVGLKLLQAGVGSAIYLVLGLASPFRRWEKLLLFSGYYVVFEYTVITRMYGVQLLLVLVYLWVRSLRPQAVLAGAGLLGLIACADLSGMVLSGALLLEFACSQRSSIRPARLAGGAAIYAVLACSALVSMLPAKDISRVTTLHTFAYLSDYDRLGASLVNYLATPYLATVTRKPGIFWDASMDVAPAAFGAFVAFVLFAYWFTFRRRPALLLMVGTTCVLMIAVGYLVYRGSVRHFGITFVAFLCGLWLLRAAGGKIAWPAYVLLGMTVVAGVDATFGSLAPGHRPFSQAGATAAWLHANHLDRGLIAGVPTAATIGVTEQLDRPLYQLECATPGQLASFYLFSNQCESYKPDMLGDRLAAALAWNHGQPFTLLREAPLSLRDIADLQLIGIKAGQVGSLTGAEATREDFSLYVIQSSR